MVSFTVDEVNKLLIVDLPDIEVTIQQIVDYVREWQDELINEDIEDFINPSGKQSLGGGLYVGITLQFRYGWKLKFADRSGPAWFLCTVSGGNIVGDGYFPVEKATFVNTIISQSTSASLLTGTDPAAVADAVWDEALTGHTGAGSFGASIKSIVGSVVAGVGLVIAGSSTTEIRTDLAKADSFFDGMFIVVQNSTGNAVRRISYYLNTNGAFNVEEPLPFVPVLGDTVYITMPVDYPPGRIT